MGRSRKRNQNRDESSQGNPTIDLMPLKEALEETAASIRLLSQPDQPLVQEVCNELASISDQLWRYSELIALGKATAAQYVVNSMGQKLLKTAAIAAENLALLDVKAAAYTTAEAALQQVVIEDTVGGELAASLSFAVAESIAAYRELEQISKAIDTLRKEVNNASSDWSIDDDVPTIYEHLQWLGIAENCFTTRASRYLINSDQYPKEDIIRYRDEAEERLNSLEEIILRAKRLHKQTRDKAQGILGDKQARYTDLIKTLKKQRSILQHHSSDLTQTLLESSKLLNESELADWITYEATPEFQNLDRTESELGTDISRIWRRLDSAPKLSSRARGIIKEAREYTDRLFDELIAEEEAPIALPITSPSNKEMKSPPPQLPVSAVGPTEYLRRMTKQVVTKATPPVLPERVDEIYQMIIAVAAHRYCGSEFMKGMTIDSVLGILRVLGEITPDEQYAYRDVITERVKSRAVKVEDTKLVHNAWVNTSPTEMDWINYPNGRASGGRFFRLVFQGKEPALYLAQRLGITDEATLYAKNVWNKTKSKLRKS